jgi:hypothetical protein
MAVKHRLSEEQKKDDWKQGRCGRLCSMEEGKQGRNEEDRNTDTRKERKIGLTSLEDAIRKSSQASSILSDDRKT